MLVGQPGKTQYSNVLIKIFREAALQNFLNVSLT